MTCIKMGSDESQFNVSVASDGQSHKTVSTNRNLFEEKGEPKRYRTEVLLLTTTERALDLYLRAAVHPRCQRPPKGTGPNMTVEATKRPSTTVNTTRIHPG